MLSLSSKALSMTVISLTPTQRAVLRAACDAPEGQLVIPPHLKGSAGQKVLEALLRRGLIVECHRNRQGAAQAAAWARYAISSEGRAAVSSLAVPAAASEEPGKTHSYVGLLIASGPAGLTPTGPEPTASPALVLGKSGSKVQAICDLLASPDGATLDQLVAQTGWLRHTVRAALSRLRQSGSVVTRVRRADGSSLYHLVVGEAGEGSQ